MPGSVYPVMNKKVIVATKRSPLIMGRAGDKLLYKVGASNTR